MTIPKTQTVTVSNRGESKAAMELNDAFRLVDNNDFWMERAKCRACDEIKWFPAQGESHLTKIAKQYCSDCPVKAECLNYATKNEIMHGVWGGKSAYERRLISVGNK